MAKRPSHELRQRIVDLAHDIGALRYLGDRLTCGARAPVVFLRTIESTASMLEAELIMIGEQLGVMNGPPAAAEGSPQPFGVWWAEKNKLPLAEEPVATKPARAEPAAT